MYTHIYMYFYVVCRGIFDFDVIHYTRTTSLTQVSEKCRIITGPHVYPNQCD